MILNSNEESWSGDEKDALMSSADMNTGSSDSELAYLLD
jgi:hypothetical protein